MSLVFYFMAIIYFSLNHEVNEFTWGSWVLLVSGMIIASIDTFLKWIKD